MIKGSNGKFTYNMVNKDIINITNIGKALFKDDKVNYAGKRTPTTSSCSLPATRCSCPAACPTWSKSPTWTTISA